MKKMICLMILACALGLAPISATAQTAKKKSSSSKAASTKTVAKTAETKKTAAAADTSDPAPAAAESKPEAKKADDKKSDDASAGAMSFGGDFPFDLAQFLKLDMDPDGMTIFTDKVHIETKEMKITCDLLKIDNKTKMMVATGNPVQMDQGAEAQLFCRNLTYNMTTKSAVLENEAKIVQIKNGQKTNIGPADTIKVDYPPDQPGKTNSNAQPKISIFNRTSNPRIIEIKADGKGNSGESRARPAAATKVSGVGSMDLIKVPSASKSPGVN